MTEATEKVDLDQLLTDMIGDDKKSIDIARVLLTKIMTQDDEYTDLTEKQVVHLSVLMAIAIKIKSVFLLAFCKHFIKYRKSLKRQDRKEAVKMNQALKEEQESLQSKFKNLLGLGT